MEAIHALKINNDEGSYSPSRGGDLSVNLVDRYKVFILCEEDKLFDPETSKIARAVRESRVNFFSSFDRTLDEQIASLKEKKLLLLIPGSDLSRESVEKIAAWVEKFKESDQVAFGLEKATLNANPSLLSCGANVQEIASYLQVNQSEQIAFLSGNPSSKEFAIPVVNMQDYYNPVKRESFVKALYDAMTSCGFFAVENVGIALEKIDAAYGEAKHFFDQNLEDKMALYDEKLGGQRGYVPGETAEKSSIKDFKEFLHIGKEEVKPDNIWPKDPGLKGALYGMYEELERYVVPLQEAIVEAINLNAKPEDRLPVSFLNDTLNPGNNLLRVLNYFPVPQELFSDPDKPFCWGAAHTDIDYIAIIPRATEKGLQVEKDGQWLDVVAPPDSFIVNVGDMLQNMTNGLFKSANHRIVPAEANVGRQSMAFFVHPDSDTQIGPLQSCVDQTGGVQDYANGTRWDFLSLRLFELGLLTPENNLDLLKALHQTGLMEQLLFYGRESKRVMKLLEENGLSIFGGGILT